jgi:two-component system LytT family sensor kinase
MAIPPLLSQTLEAAQDPGARTMDSALMVAPGTPTLLHLAGYLTGASLYAMLLVMVARGRPQADRLSLGTAALGLCWNVGELSAHLALALGANPLVPWLSAASYAALGLLAAVVVHSVSRVRAREDERLETESGSSLSVTTWLARCAYACALVAGVIHLRAAAVGAPLPSPLGLAIVTVGLAVLAGPLAWISARQSHSSRALWMTALALFAVSALHLGRFHGSNESWLTELIGHHASIPLAFAILYQEYRFALADLFLKQALTLIAVVVLVLGVWVAVSPLVLAGDPTAVGLLLVAWVATALCFPGIRRGVTAFVDRIVLSRASTADVLDQLTAAVAEAQSEDAVVAEACKRLTPAINATTIDWTARNVQGDEELASNQVVVWTAHPPQYVLSVGPLVGGRRLLSGDRSMLERATVVIGRRIEAVRFMSERYERMNREREIRSLATEAELRALRAQVNPHFLFNALTTIGYLIQTAPPRALATLMKLTTLLRSVLRSEGEFTTLGRERELIECYLEIERARFEERLRVDIQIPAELLDTPIPALIVQPLVENAIKHGVAPARSGGTIWVSAKAPRGPTGMVHISVRNTGTPLGPRRVASAGHLGLRSIEQRLRCHYGSRAVLTLTRAGDGSTMAELILPRVAGVDRDVLASQEPA